MVKPGVTTEEIDRVVHDETIARGAYPSPLNYHNFPKSCCTYVYNGFGELTLADPTAVTAFAFDELTLC